MPLPASPKDKELSYSYDQESPTRHSARPISRHCRAESMKLDQLYFARQHRHAPSASMSRISPDRASVVASPSAGQSSYSSSSPSSRHHEHDISSIADQLTTISTTATTILTTLQSLMRRSKDNAMGLESLKNQILESKERNLQTLDEIKRFLSLSNTTVDLTPLYEKLDSLRPIQPESTPAPPPPPQPIISTHKLDEEKRVVEDILTNANQALSHLLTLTETINNLTNHLETNTSRLTAEESQIADLQSRKSTLEAELARLDATIHLRNLELASFTKKTEVLEARILRAKTAIQVSGGAPNHVKMKKSAIILGSEGAMASIGSKKPYTPGTRELRVTPQRRILSLSSTNNKPSPARAMMEVSASSSTGSSSSGTRKTSWGKRLGGMLGGLTASSTSNKENDSGSTRSGKSQTSGGTVAGRDVVGLGMPPIPVRGRSVSARTK